MANKIVKRMGDFSALNISKMPKVKLNSLEIKDLKKSIIKRITKNVMDVPTQVMEGLEALTLKRHPHSNAGELEEAEKFYRGNILYWQWEYRHIRHGYIYDNLDITSRKYKEFTEENKILVHNSDCNCWYTDPNNEIPYSDFNGLAYMQDKNYDVLPGEMDLYGYIWYRAMRNCEYTDSFKPNNSWKREDDDLFWKHPLIYENERLMKVISKETLPFDCVKLKLIKDAKLEDDEDLKLLLKMLTFSDDVEIYLNYIERLGAQFLWHTLPYKADKKIKWILAFWSTVDASGELDVDEEFILNLRKMFEWWVMEKKDFESQKQETESIPEPLPAQPEDPPKYATVTPEFEWVDKNLIFDETLRGKKGLLFSEILKKYSPGLTGKHPKLENALAEKFKDCPDWKKQSSMDRGKNRYRLKFVVETS